MGYAGRSPKFSQAQKATALEHYVTYDYCIAATIITSQLPIEHWHAWVGEATIADAILDRLMQQYRRLTLTGESSGRSPNPSRRRRTQTHRDRHFYKLNAQLNTHGDRLRQSGISGHIRRNTHFGVRCAARRLNACRFIWPREIDRVAPIAISQAQFDALVVGIPHERPHQTTYAVKQPHRRTPSA